MAIFKTCLFSYALAALLLVQTASSRKSYLVKRDHNLKLQPAVVQQTTYDCTRCWFKNDNDQSCVDYGADWEIGWNWY